MRRWYSGEAWWSAAFALIGLGLVACSIDAAWETREWNFGETLVSLIALGCMYWTLALFLNRTRIESSASRVSVRHGPLPWRGAVEIERSQLRKVFAEMILTGKRGKTKTYRVAAVLGGFYKMPFVNGPMSREDALTLAKLLREQIGLADSGEDAALR